MPRLTHRPVCSLLVTMGLIAGVTISVAPSAAAAGSWSYTPTPTPPGVTSASLHAIACPTTTSCFAVGTYTNASGRFMRTMHWSGTEWSIQATPNPVGATSSSLNGVACPSPISCFAVGQSYGRSGLRTIALHWNGSAWAIQPTQTPLGTTISGFHAVACPTAKSCFAVGEYATTAAPGFKTLVEHWNGTKWGIQPSPNPSTAFSATLHGVSCPLSQSCFAVGSWVRSPSRTKALVAHWNGHEWGLQGVPNPSDARSTFLHGVSCPVPQSCFAVGSNFSFSGGKNLVEHWNGHAWGVQGAPIGAENPVLHGVACPFAGSCFAVGYTSAARGLVEHWNGTQWGPMGSPQPGTSFNRLLGVACPSLRICFAVGEYSSTGSKSFAIRYR
jgi:hypothetical protein